MRRVSSGEDYVNLANFYMERPLSLWSLDRPEEVVGLCAGEHIDPLH